MLHNVRFLPVCGSQSILWNPTGHFIYLFITSLTYNIPDSERSADDTFQ